MEPIFRTKEPRNSPLQAGEATHDTRHESVHKFIVNAMEKMLLKRDKSLTTKNASSSREPRAAVIETPLPDYSTAWNALLPLRRWDIQVAGDFRRFVAVCEPKEVIYNVIGTSIDDRAACPWIAFYEDTVLAYLIQALPNAGREVLATIAQWLAKGRCSNSQCQKATQNLVGAHVKFGMDAAAGHQIVPLCRSCNRIAATEPMLLKPNVVTVGVSALLGLDEDSLFGLVRLLYVMQEAVDRGDDDEAIRRKFGAENEKTLKKWKDAKNPEVQDARKNRRDRQQRGKKQDQQQQAPRQQQQNRGRQQQQVSHVDAQEIICPRRGDLKFPDQKPNVMVFVCAGLPYFGNFARQVFELMRDGWIAEEGAGQITDRWRISVRLWAPGSGGPSQSSRPDEGLAVRFIPRQRMMWEALKRARDQVRTRKRQCRTVRLWFVNDRRAHVLVRFE